MVHCSSRLTTTARCRRGSTPTLHRSPRAWTCHSFSTTCPAAPVGMSSPRRLSGLPNFGPIVAVKEASGSLDQVSELLCRTNLTILSGDDSLTLPMLALGAEGVISVVANLVPRDMMALISAFEQGDREEARRLHLKLFPLCRDLLSIAANPIPVKTALAMLGRGNGEFRLPLLPARRIGTTGHSE